MFTGLGKRQRLTARRTKIGKWTVRSRVDVLLGSKQTTQELIDSGYYETRMVKTKTGGSVEEVRFHEEQEIQAEGFQSVQRFAKSKLMSDDEKGALKAMLTEFHTAEETKSKGAGMATRDPPAKKKTSAAKAKSGAPPKKRPASSTVVPKQQPSVTSEPAVKKERGAGQTNPKAAKITGGALDKKNEEDEAENETVNKALANALAQIRSTELPLVQFEATLSEHDAVGRELSMKNMFLDDLAKTKGEREALVPRCLHLIASCKAMKWHGEKMAHLHDAAEYVSFVTKLSKDSTRSGCDMDGETTFFSC